MRHFLTGATDSLSKHAAHLHLAALEISNGIKSGGFRSLVRGRGIELSGVREYLCGDDIRLIDWNVTARMERPFDQVLAEDHDVPIFLIVDRSASMFSGSNEKVRYAAAAECAALIVLAAELCGSPVGAVFFDGAMRFSCRPKYGRRHTMLLLSRLDEVSEIKQGSALKTALKGTSALLTNRSLIFIISDFRSAHWEEPFKLLVQAHTVSCIRISDPSEHELPPVGTVPFFDIESGTHRELPLSSERFRSAWRAAYHKRTEQLQTLCARYGASFLSVSTEESAVRSLTAFFSARTR